MNKKEKNTAPQNDLFNSFSQDELNAILTEAKQKKDKTTAKNALVTQAKETIIFVQSSTVQDFFKDKPDIFGLAYVTTDPKGNEVVKYEHKRNTFWQCIANHCKGSELAKAIQSVISTTATAPAK